MTREIESAEREGRRPSRSERAARRGRMRDLLLLLPNLVKLLVRLVRDPRVSRADKVILGGTLFYVIAPLDFLPDMIPFLGLVDDSYLVAISLVRLLNRADGDVVAEHWEGEMDIKKLVGSVIEVASVFLPKPIRAALTARMEIREPRNLRVVRGQKGERQHAQQ